MLPQPKYRAIYQFAVGIWLTLSIAGVVLAGVCWVRLTDTVATVRHWDSVGPQLDQILQTMLDSETGVRGYLITGNTNYLDPYYRAQSEYEHEFDNLAVMTADNPV